MVIINKSDNPIKDLKEIEQKVEKIFSFLAKVHPSAMEEGFHNPIEIRFLHRHEDGTSGLHSANLFGLNEKSKKHFVESIVNYADKNICTYYSGYKYDYNYKCELKRKKRNGEHYTIYGQPRKIKTESALGTQELVADFDSMNFEEFSFYNNILKSVGIESLVVFTGHGYQLHILLDQYHEDNTLFSKFTKKLLELGFKVDGSIGEQARVLRLPYTLNCKEFDGKKFKTDTPTAIETKLIETTDKRYSKEFVFKKLDELIAERERSLYQERKDGEEEFMALMAPDWVAETPLPSKVAEKKTAKNKVKAKQELKNEESESKQESSHAIRTEQYFANRYEHLNFMKLKSPLKFILMGVDEGIRNDALLFLLPFLRNDLGLSIQQVKETLTVWGENCFPPYSPGFVSNEVERLWKYDNKATYGRYGKALEDIYGALEIFHVVVSDRQIAVENKLFKVLDKLDGAALKVYLTMKLLEKEEELTQFSNEDIIERAKISESTFKRAMKSLVLTKLINKKVMGISKKSGGKYKYSINTLGNEIYGYTKLETATVDLIIRDSLSKYEIAFFVFLCAKTWSSTAKVLYMSRENIAEAIGSSSETTISKITDKLAKLKFIRKKTEQYGRKKICEYTLIK